MLENTAFPCVMLNQRRQRVALFFFFPSKREKGLKSSYAIPALPSHRGVMFVGRSASKRAQAPGIDRTFTRVGAGAETGGRQRRRGSRWQIRSGSNPYLNRFFFLEKTGRGE